MPRTPLMTRRQVRICHEAKEQLEQGAPPSTAWRLRPALMPIMRAMVHTLHSGDSVVEHGIGVAALAGHAFVAQSDAILTRDAVYTRVLQLMTPLQPRSRLLSDWSRMTLLGMSLVLPAGWSTACLLGADLLAIARFIENVRFTTRRDELLTALASRPTVRATPSTASGTPPAKARHAAPPRTAAQIARAPDPAAQKRDPRTAEALLEAALEALGQVLPDDAIKPVRPAAAFCRAMRELQKHPDAPRDLLAHVPLEGRRRYAAAARRLDRHAALHPAGHLHALLAHDPACRALLTGLAEGSPARRGEAHE